MTTWIEIKLVLRHYVPEKIEPGMLFLNTLYPNNDEKELTEVWAITEDHLDEHIDDEFIIYENGYPVEPYLIQEECNLIVTPDEIGWFDAGERADSLIEFGIPEINFILREFDGWLEVAIDEDSLDDDIIQPVLDDDWVILKFIDEEQDDDE